ncbi:MAG: D-alanine--D-alanine ligase [Acidobacteria bacterium]|nr:D-alanine--D-alanine ligase [Acidobacteriota bacterium]
MSRRTLALVFGGRSPEYDVSLVSARGIRDNLDPRAYEVVLVGVDRAGMVRVGGDELLSGGLDAGAGTPARWPAAPGDRTLREEGSGRVLSPPIDVAFPIVHGSGGEDGTLQGVFALAGIPFVGSGVLGSALAMDKDRARRVLGAEGIPGVADVVVAGSELDDVPAVAARVSGLGWPVFVKPARAGSSVGITRVERGEDLPAALAAARAVDGKVVIERAVRDAREIEVAVLGNEFPETTVPGEIVPSRAFYDYDAKYKDPNSHLLVPAPLAEDLVARVREMAARAFRALDLAGMARVDFLLSRADGELVLNEVNTLPGFTPISMYPRLWQQMGVSYSALLDRLVDLAFDAANSSPLAIRG